MSPNQSTVPFGGILLLKVSVFSDSRGHFFELFRQTNWTDGPVEFVQDNVSVSKQNVIRGLHYQHPYAQGKLVTVLAGEVYDVAVDIRQDSPTFRHWFGAALSESAHNQLYVPPGFAHGFAVMSESATVLYKCTDYYQADCDASIRWDDPALAIDWPVTDPVLSAKDAGAPFLAAVAPGRLPAIGMSAAHAR